jgi:hypothetical protein
LPRKVATPNLFDIQKDLAAESGGKKLKHADLIDRYVDALLVGVRQNYPHVLPVRDIRTLRRRNAQRQWSDDKTFAAWASDRNLRSPDDYRFVTAPTEYGHPAYVAFKDGNAAMEFKFRWS